MIITDKHPNIVLEKGGQYVHKGDISCTDGNLLILLSGSLEVCGNISSRESIFANCDLRASHTIDTGKDICVAGSLHAEGRIDADGNIYAGKSIYASCGVYAGHDIISGEGISSAWEIEAERVCSGGDVKASEPISHTIKFDTLGTISYSRGYFAD